MSTLELEELAVMLGGVLEGWIRQGSRDSLIVGIPPPIKIGGKFTKAVWAW